jgi:hypothetical protein
LRAQFATRQITRQSLFSPTSPFPASTFSYEAIGEIDERVHLAQPFALLRTVLSTDTKGRLWWTPCTLLQDLYLFSVKLFELAYGPKKATEEIGNPRVARCPPIVVCEVLCFLGQIQMALMVLLPLPQIEIEPGLSALCTLPHEKRFFDYRRISRARGQHSARLGSNVKSAPDGVMSRAFTHPSFEMSPVGSGMFRSLSSVANTC